MDNVSSLNQIKIALEALLIQTERMEKGEQPLHPIDKDLLLEKTRTLYEQMMALEYAGKEEKAPELAPTQEEEAPVDQEIAEMIVEKEENVAETDTIESIETAEHKSEKMIPEPEDNPEAAEISVAEEKTPEPISEEELIEEKHVPVEKTEKPAEPPKITLDLFSEAPPETLGDTLTSAEKPAVADSLQKNSINDLREAIGINDKFLFINELFNGDLERYNKVVDELNSFSGLSGAQTYLAELQVQYQWNENGLAYQKLNVLLERKFN